MRRALIALVPLALAGAAAPDDAMSQDRRSTTLRPPRDGDIAVREELDAARRAGTIAAYDLFIARHPKHALAVAARREREQLVRRRRPVASD
jgi:hypothetical protein